MVFEVDIRGNVPVYGQEACIWCGAACGQMIMDGYPDPAHRIFYPQVDVWNTIQAQNSANPADSAWATDPIGLRACLALLNPPPGGNWSVHMNTNRDTVMFDILYWMNRNHYPLATLINRGGHWVAIVRYVSDIEPVAGSTPNLQEITKYDPEPHNVGSISTMTAAVWYATDWVGPVIYAGSWLNNYVAVIEPPVAKGRVEVKRVRRTGTRIIRPRTAVRYARRWIDELELAEKPPYAILKKEGIRNLEPILVREERAGLDRRARVPYYYLVPFGLEEEKGDCGEQLARVSIVVNAFTGRFEEIGSFGKPVRYIPEKEAINIVARALRLKKEEAKQAKATMMFKPSDITHIRIYPFWAITFEKHVLYVDQLGKLYKTIRPSVPGD